MKPNAMTCGEHYDAFRVLSEAFLGAGEDGAVDDTYAGLEVGLVGAGYQLGCRVVKDKER